MTDRKPALSDVRTHQIVMMAATCRVLGFTPQPPDPHDRDALRSWWVANGDLLILTCHQVRLQLIHPIVTMYAAGALASGKPGMSDELAPLTAHELGAVCRYVVDEGASGGSILHEAVAVLQRDGKAFDARPPAPSPEWDGLDPFVDRVRRDLGLRPETSGRDHREEDGMGTMAEITPSEVVDRSVEALGHMVEMIQERWPGMPYMFFAKVFLEDPEGGGDPVELEVPDLRVWEQDGEGVQALDLRATVLACHEWVSAYGEGREDVRGTRTRLEMGFVPDLSRSPLDGLDDDITIQYGIPDPEGKALGVQVVKIHAQEAANEDEGLDTFAGLFEAVRAGAIPTDDTAWGIPTVEAQDLTVERALALIEAGLPAHEFMAHLISNPIEQAEAFNTIALMRRRIQDVRAIVAAARRTTTIH